MAHWTNYFVRTTKAYATEGHIPADDLRKTIEINNGGEAYHCAYDLEDRPDFSHYDGVMRPALGYVHFDFDSRDDAGLQALVDTRAFCDWLDIPDATLFFSGSKGFHVGVPFSYFGLGETKDLCVRLNALAGVLKGRFATLDTTIYNANRKFRALGSKHPKTGLFKISLTLHELRMLSLDAIKLKARRRGSLDIPFPELRQAHTKLTELLIPPRNQPSPDEPRGGVRKEWIAPTGEAAFEKCAFLGRCKASPASITEPEWYAALSIVSRFQDGRKQCHGLSHGHPKYNKNECNEKIDQAEKESAPRTCESISKLWDGCTSCPQWGKINSPVNILTPEEKKELAARAPKELDIAKNIILQFEDTLLRHDKSIFRYVKNHWKELSPTQLDSFKKMIMDVCGGRIKSKDVDSIYKTLFRELPPVPEEVKLRDPHPFCANFLNGTLHIRQSKDFFYSTEFLPHNKKDYLNTVLPYSYDPSNKEVNTPFLEMLDRIFKGDPDKEEKIRAIRQMYGACLVPAFPRLFFLYGLSGCGKSTLMLIAKKFLSDNNISGVQPQKFFGFHLEAMLGKLVNIVTDVETKKPIEDSTIKTIIDRTPVYVERKGITNVYGLIPAIHLFGGNAIPPTLEGELNAHTRRWTFIGFNNVQTGEEGSLYNKEFPHWVFEQSPQGILNFALEGLNDLIAQRGHYTVPASGKEKMKQWQAESDTVALFLEDVAAEEVFASEESKRVVLRLSPEGQVSRAKLYEIYRDWLELSGHVKLGSAELRSHPQVRHKFFDALDRKQFNKKTVRGLRQYVGFSLGAGQGAEF